MGCMKPGTFRRHASAVAVSNIGNRTWPVVDVQAAAGAIAHQGEPDRKLPGILGNRPLCSAAHAEAAHAFGDVGREVRSRHLSVIADIDPGGELFLDHSKGRPLHTGVKVCLRYFLSCLAGDNQVGEPLDTRQAAGMGRQDAVLAGEHGAAPALAGSFYAVIGIRPR